MESRNLSRLPSFDKESGALNIIVETPRNGRIKYKYNEKNGMFELDKTFALRIFFSLLIWVCALDNWRRRGSPGCAGSVRCSHVSGMPRAGSNLDRKSV